MKVVIPKELLQSEQRVAATPKTVTRLIKQGFEVYIETGAGLKAKYSDEELKLPVQISSLLLKSYIPWQISFLKSSHRQNKKSS